MKKIILSLVAAVFAVSSFAADTAKVKKTPEQVAAKRADKLKTELGLTDEQRSKVYNAVLEKINKTKEIKQRYKDSSNRKGRDKEIKAVKANFETTMNSILSPEQKTKYEAIKKKDKDDDDEDDDDDDKEDRKKSKVKKARKAKKS